MIKVVEIIKRKPDLDVETFQQYWLTTHGPIVARLPGLRRYVQSHTRLGGYRRGDPPYDGATRDDEPNFLGAEPAVILTTEPVIVG